MCHPLYYIQWNAINAARHPRILVQTEFEWFLPLCVFSYALVYEWELIRAGIVIPTTPAVLKVIHNTSKMHHLLQRNENTRRWKAHGTINCLVQCRLYTIHWNRRWQRVCKWYVCKLYKLNDINFCQRTNQPTIIFSKR